MIILGIDPGTEACGWAIIDARPELETPKWLYSGVLVPKGGTGHGRLRSLYWQIQNVVQEHQIDEAAMEEGFVGGSRVATRVLAEARGVCIVATHPLKVYRYPISTVKKCATGDGRAKKHKMIQYMVHRFNIPTGLTHDEADALAVALTHSERRR